LQSDGHFSFKGQTYGGGHGVARGGYNFTVELRLKPAGRRVPYERQTLHPNILMQKRTTLSRALLVFTLFALLCAGVFVPRVEKVTARPELQTPLCSSGAIITSWTFLGDLTTPSTGSGLFSSGTGLSTASFPTGNPDPAISFSSWNTATIDETAYVEFEVDTSGVSSINLAFDYRRSSSGPQTLQVRYSLDGILFTDYGSAIATGAADTWISQNIDLSPISALDNNPNATFRIYGYAASSAAGTLRFDNVTFSCAPMVIIDSVTPALTSSGTAITWHAYDDGSSYELRVGGMDCSSGTVVDSGIYSGSPTPVTFNIAAGSLVEGSNTLRVCVTDALSNTGSAVSTVVKDTVAPSIISFTRQSPMTSVTNSDVLIFRATFNENVVGVDVADFIRDSTSTATVTNVNPISGSIYDITISGGDLPSFNGTVGLNFSSPSITDTIGFPFINAEPTIDEIFTVDNTATQTPTVTPTRTLTPTPPNASVLSILINEVAWSGTSSARDGDEWIELYNTESVARNLNGWRLTIDTSSDQSAETTLVAFTSADTILPGNFFLLARENSSGNFDIFTNVTEDKGFEMNTPSSIPNTGIIVLRLYSPQNLLIDTANNGKNSGWYAGTASSTYATMERKAGKVLDSSSAWNTFSGATFALNRDNSVVRGTPKRANSAITTTPSRTRTPTLVPTAVPVGRPVLNEILARPGFDWNQDGSVDVFDEFIEIKNLGPVDVNIGGWKIDDIANGGSNPYTLPSAVLKPGERMVVYGLQSNILLSDGGDTVRLLNTSNKVFDSYTYKVAKVVDESVCRMPDGNGNWYEDCLPTPKFTNQRDGESPVMPGEGFESPVCGLPDTLPEAFLIAECRGYGANLWRALFWDADGWGGDTYVPANKSKWETFVE
jgi:hypothetical protein